MENDLIKKFDKNKYDNTIGIGIDVGIMSLGIAVRKGMEIVYAKSYVFDPNLADSKPAILKNRIIKTRLAHRAREMWLNHQCQKVGIPPLKKFQIKKNNIWQDIENDHILETNEKYRIINLDDRLKKEFPSKNEPDTCYNSALLRIKAIEGEKLEPWQAYKALHSCIQKRGYDDNIPWISTSSDLTDEKKKEQEETKEQLNTWLKEVREWPEQYQRPCYFEAFKIGLWDEEKGIISNKINYDDCNEAKGSTYPRANVIKEATEILTGLKKHYPQIDIDLFLFGPAKKAYASHPKIKKTITDINAKKNLRQGHISDWQGMFAQKLPRFDNRILSKCRIINRFNVASIKNIQDLYDKYLLITYLRNTRFIDQGTIRPLGAVEFKEVFESSYQKWIALEKSKTWNEFKKIVTKELAHGIKIKPSQEKYDLKQSGRASYSKPTLNILINYYLCGGKSVGEFYDELINLPCSQNSTTAIKDNKEKNKGLTVQDLKWFQDRSNITWNDFHIDDGREFDSVLNKEDELKKILNKPTQNTLRHRLHFFHQELKKIKECILVGEVPTYINLEVIRDDFMSEKKKKDLNKKNETNKNKNLELKEKYQKELEKAKLAEAQNWKDLYDQSDIDKNNLHNYEIDHIIPRALGGPDIFDNKILTSRKNNKEKSGRSPASWLVFESTRWEKFNQCVFDVYNQKKSKISENKYHLLTANHEKATQLAYDLDKAGITQTSYISRIVHKIIELEYDIKSGKSGEEQIIYFPSGAITSKMRKLCGLNKIIAMDQLNEDEKKNRSNPLHHALDAISMSFLEPTLLRNLNKYSFNEVYETRQIIKAEKTDLPIKIESIIDQKIKNIVPSKIKNEKGSILEENFYGIRNINGTNVPTTRNTIEDLIVKKNLSGKILGLNEKVDKISEKIITTNEKMVLSFVNALKKIKLHEETSEKGKKTLIFKDNILKISFNKKDGTPQSMKIKKINLSLKKIEDENTISDEFITRNIKDSKQEKGVMKPKGSHKCSLIFKLIKGAKTSYQIKPVYAWQNTYETIEKIKKEMVLNNPNSAITFIAKVTAGDLITLKEDYADDKFIFKKGIFKISLKTNGQANINETLIGIAHVDRIFKLDEQESLK